MRPFAPLSASAVKRKRNKTVFGTVLAGGRYPMQQQEEGGTPHAEGIAAAVDRIVRALRAQYDGIVQEPVPKRWVELINYLNDKDQKRREGLLRRPGSEISN